MQMPTDNQKLLVMLPHASLTNASHTGQHDDAQCCITGGRLIQLNNTPQKVTTTPNLAHADTTTPYYTKIPEKVTLQLPQHQPHHYKNTVINQTAIGTTDRPTTANHQQTHPCTQNDAPQPTHPPTNVTNTSATSYQFILALATFPWIENQIPQQNNPSNSDIVSLCTPQMEIASATHELLKVPQKCQMACSTIEMCQAEGPASASEHIQCLGTSPITFLPDNW